MRILHLWLDKADSKVLIVPTKESYYLFKHLKFLHEALAAAV